MSNATIAVSEQQEIKVIGAGLTRTGTSSLKTALEILGYGPCHHMSELRGRVSRCREFLSTYQGKPTDWRARMAGWGSTVDHPTADFVPELMAAFPDAKVVLTVRDSTAVWWKSYSDTIGQQRSAWNGAVVYSVPPMFTFWRVVRAWDDFRQRAYGTGPEAYEEHNKRMMEIVPKERLLIFNVKEGWDPLCNFLGVETPKVPFPRSNETRDMHRRYRTRRIVGLMAWVVELGALALLVRQVIKKKWVEQISTKLFASLGYW